MHLAIDGEEELPLDRVEFRDQIVQLVQRPDLSRLLVR